MTAQLGVLAFMALLSITLIGTVVFHAGLLAMPLVMWARISAGNPAKAAVWQALGGATFMGLCIWGLQFTPEATSHGWPVFAAAVAGICASIAGAVWMLWAMIASTAAPSEEESRG